MHPGYKMDENLFEHLYTMEIWLFLLESYYI